MKTAVYIESSVISYLTARPSRDVVKSARQAITEEWWMQQRQRFKEAQEYTEAYTFKERFKNVLKIALFGLLFVVFFDFHPS